MNKKSFMIILFTLLMSMTGTKAFAQDVEIANSDGVTIYYVWANKEKRSLQSPIEECQLLPMKIILAISHVDCPKGYKISLSVHCRMGQVPKYC